MQPIYISISIWQDTSDKAQAKKFHKKGTSESTSDKKRETFGKKREARFFIIITFYNCNL